jgi:anti-anti-sigma regulatory factor
MAVIRHSNKVSILVLTAEAIASGELDEVLTSVSCGEATHFLVDMSSLEELGAADAMKIFQLKSGLGVWGSKLIVVGISRDVKQVFSRRGIVNQLDFAADEKTALGWLGEIVSD